MNSSTRGTIQSMDELDVYSPPNHSGTRNVRLIEASEGAGFELVHGTMDSSGEALRHSHALSYQAIFVTGGEAHVELGTDEPRRCGPGSIIRIPPGVEHYVKSVGSEPLEMVIVYAPPLAPRQARS